MIIRAFIGDVHFKNIFHKDLIIFFNKICVTKFYDQLGTLVANMTFFTLVSFEGGISLLRCTQKVQAPASFIEAQ